MPSRRVSSWRSGYEAARYNLTHPPVPIAHIITKLELGGAQHNTLFTVTHLDRSRFRPILITGEPGLLDAHAASLDAEWHQVGSLRRDIRPWSDFSALVTLTRLLKRLKPRIVHTHSSKAGILGRWAAYLAGVPIIIHSIHGYGFTPDQGRLAREFLILLERMTGRITTRFFAVSESNRDQGVALRFFAKESCAIVRSGIDLARIRQHRADARAIRSDLGLKPSGPVVGMVAPLKPQKAPLDFVRMSALVRSVVRDAQFVLIGDGELRRAVEAEVRQRVLQHCFYLAGWKPNAAELMAAFDVLVLTSRWEGLPRVYLEALANGVPVVGTSVDGAREVIKDGINGFLRPPGDVIGLAERTVWLLERPERAKAMGAQGRALPREFDIYNMVRQQEREYAALVGTDAANGTRQGCPAKPSAGSLNQGVAE